MFFLPSGFFRNVHKSLVNLILQNSNSCIQIALDVFLEETKENFVFAPSDERLLLGVRCFPDFSSIDINERGNELGL